MTGPNTSSQETFACAGALARSVGATDVPSRVPPASSSAPEATASSIQDAMRSAEASLITGPTATSGSSGEPVFRAFIFSTKSGTKRSYNDSSTRTLCTDTQDCPAW